jgi:holo-[acyl-carrier protein] synthase
MIKGVGTDLVKIDRITRSLEKNGDRFAERILSKEELKRFKSSAMQDNFLAKRFAIKEAVSKALGTGISSGISWKDIELSHLDSGQPIVVLYHKAKERLNDLKAETIHVSLSDESGLVSAFAIIS